MLENVGNQNSYSTFNSMKYSTNYSMIYSTIFSIRVIKKKEKRWYINACSRLKRKQGDHMPATTPTIPHPVIKAAQSRTADDLVALANLNRPIIIPATVHNDNNLSPFARLLYGALLTVTKQTGRPFITLGDKVIARHYDRSPYAINRAIYALVKAGYVRISNYQNYYYTGQPAGRRRIIWPLLDQYSNPINEERR